jgi:hypothetical protein
VELKRSLACESPAFVPGTWGSVLGGQHMSLHVTSCGLSKLLGKV